MTERTIKRICFISSLALSALILLVAVLSICTAVGIYQSGDQPYTPESVANGFKTVAVPMVICAIWALFTWIIHPVPENQRIRGEADLSASLSRISEKVEFEHAPAETVSEVKHEHKKRKIYLIFVISIYILCSLAVLVYLFLPESFSSDDFNSDILKCTLVVFGCMAFPFASSIVYVILTRKSIKKELSLLKSALAAQPKASTSTNPNNIKPMPRKNTALVINIVRCVLLLAGSILIVLGVFNGGEDDVLGKAIRICTECIGLG